LGGVLDPVVDDHEIRFLPGLQLHPCGSKPVFHLGGVLGASACEAPDEFLPRGRRDEHELRFREVPLHLARPLEIDLQEHVPARCDRINNFPAGCAIAVRAVNNRVFQQLPGIHLLSESLFGDEVIADPVDLPRSRLSGGEGDGNVDAGTQLAQPCAHGALADAAGTGNDPNRGLSG
jgi:hypothetical protein